jgi:hypothetical protein
MKINIIIKESWGFIHTNIFQGTLNWDAQTEHAVAKSKIIVVGFQISKKNSSCNQFQQITMALFSMHEMFGFNS